jgi:hypothetical protein
MNGTRRRWRHSPKVAGGSEPNDARFRSEADMHGRLAFAGLGRE